jgi:hypothetical protein
MKAHFGKHKNKELSEIPSGYLKWCVEKLDPASDPKYEFTADGVPLSAEEVDSKQRKMRNFLAEAKDELVNREQT